MHVHAPHVNVLTLSALVLLSCVPLCRHEAELNDNNYWLGLLARMYMHTDILCSSAVVMCYVLQARVGAE
jgi:hypothetical protein